MLQRDCASRSEPASRGDYILDRRKLYHAPCGAIAFPERLFTCRRRSRSRYAATTGIMGVLLRGCGRAAMRKLMAGPPALHGSEPGQIRKEAAKAILCKCRGSGSPPIFFCDIIAIPEKKRLS